ncbi:hypothetical protein Tco_0979238, partial [Tanacetum coccineum]
VLCTNTTNGYQFTMSNQHKDWLVQEQTALGKDFSNPALKNSCCKDNKRRLEVLQIKNNLKNSIYNILRKLKMLMEAVLLSLKDLEPKQPKEEQQPVSDSKSPMTNHIAPIKTDTTTQASTASCSDSPSQFMSPCNSTSSADQSSSMTPSIVSSSDADMVVRTKATFTVGKTLSSNIMDGLLRRWDMNFFNNR